MWWDKGSKYVTTDGSGQASFRFTILDKPAMVKANFLGDWDNKPSQVAFKLQPLGESPVTSIEFFLLVIISLLVIFSYRWFRKKRMDLYSIWQELKGEVEE